MYCVNGVRFLLFRDRDIARALRRRVVSRMTAPRLRAERAFVVLGTPATGGSMSEEEVTLPEAARLLGCTWSIAWNALLNGKLDGHKPGRTYLVTRASVERFRAERHEPAVA